jgi:hypothetical protein
MNDKNVIDFEEKKKKSLTNSESVKVGKGEELDIVIRVFDQVSDGGDDKVSENAWYLAEELKDAYEKLLEDWNIADYKAIVVNVSEKKKTVGSDPLVVKISRAEKTLKKQLEQEIKRVKKRVWRDIFDQLYKLFEANKPEGWEEGGKK